MLHPLLRTVGLRGFEGWQRGEIITGFNFGVRVQHDSVLSALFKFSLTKLEVGKAQVPGPGFFQTSEVIPDYLPIAPFFFLICMDVVPTFMPVYHICAW